MAKKREIMRVFVDSTRMSEVIDVVKLRLKSRIKQRPLFIVTAYSESILEVWSNGVFKKALDKAQLIVPDGVSVVAAMDYVSKPRSSMLVLGWVIDIARGLAVGARILKGDYRDKTVVGVELMRELVARAVENEWKVMFVGGWDGVATKAANKFKIQNLKFEIEVVDGPKEVKSISKLENDKLISQINELAPDLLFVAFGRFKQEVWISENMNKLKVGMVMGVGSAFDEIAGVGAWSRVPTWVSRMGLKWLWRVGVEPGHWKRAFKAFPVFPMRLFLWYRGACESESRSDRRIG